MFDSSWPQLGSHQTYFSFFFITQKVEDKTRADEVDSNCAVMDANCRAGPVNFKSSQKFEVFYLRDTSV